MSSNIGTYDLGTDGKTILLSLINYIEGTDFAITDFIFTDPIALNYTDPLTNKTTNSQIKLNYNASSGNYGVKTIHYNRIRASEFGDISILRQAADLPVDFLSFINKKFGVAIAENEVVSVPVPNGEQVNLLLEFKPNSIIYMGSSVVHVNIPYVAPPVVLTMPVMPDYYIGGASIRYENFFTVVYTDGIAELIFQTKYPIELNFVTFVSGQTYAQAIKQLVSVLPKPLPITSDIDSAYPQREVQLSLFGGQQIQNGFTVPNELLPNPDGLAQGTKIFNKMVSTSNTYYSSGISISIVTRDAQSSPSVTDSSLTDLINTYYDQLNQLNLDNTAAYEAALALYNASLP